MTCLISAVKYGSMKTYQVIIIHHPALLALHLVRATACEVAPGTCMQCAWCRAWNA